MELLNSNGNELFYAKHSRFSFSWDEQEFAYNSQNICDEILKFKKKTSLNHPGRPYLAGVFSVEARADEGKQSAPSGTCSSLLKALGGAALGFFALYEGSRYGLEHIVTAIEQARMDECRDTVTNKDVMAWINRTDAFKTENENAQKRLTIIKETITKKLKERLPQCQPRFVEVPVLFHNGKEWDPNMVNSVLVEGTIISPVPTVGTFARYLENEYKTLGLQVRFLDTYDYAYRAWGDIHCVTNTIRFCRNRTGL